MDEEMNIGGMEAAKPKGKSVIAITGASGFIGCRLVESLSRREDVEVRVLVRGREHPFKVYPELSVVTGDLAKIETLADFLRPGCTVINLAYDFSATSAENLRSTDNLLRACTDARISRLIHCSTASVFGHVKQDILNEEVVCNPTSEYGITKLSIETLLREGAHGNFEFVNLRPTSVFGPGGPALKKLIDNLKSRHALINYLNSCLFNERKLNLISVDTLVAAIWFLFDRPHDIDGQTFIISEDDEEINNFAFVERYLFREICGKEYALRPIKIPLKVLAFVLRAMGRDNANPLRVFESGKIRKLGFRSPRSLEISLRDFARWRVEQNDIDGDRTPSITKE